LGVKLSDIAKVISQFKGVARRMDLVSMKKMNMLIIDDYAHHPTELERNDQYNQESSFNDYKIVASF
jgi:UDP-N-acetylmuramate-alanine ligase